jgi:small subunit ribosomal protein S4e
MPGANVVMAGKKHISRLAAPATWPIARKETKWIARPLPGAHTLEKGMPLIVYIRDLLNVVQSNKEAKSILNQKLILVNGIAVKEPNFAVGLFDTLKILKYDKTYRVLLNQRGKLCLIEISERELYTRPAKVVGKTTIKKGKIQIHLSNGWNFITDKDVYKTSDILLMDAKTRKPIKHIKLAKGCVIYITGGSHVGRVAEVEGFLEEGLLRKKKFILAKISDQKIKVLASEVFAIGAEQPEIKVE